MSPVLFSQAKDWLHEVSSGDRVLVVHDADCDGFCSGILLYDWCVKQGAFVGHHAFFRGRSTLRDVDVSLYNKVIITDIPLHHVASDQKLLKGKSVLYLDHHKKGVEVLDEHIVELNTSFQGYIPCSRTAYELTGLKPWLGLAGTVGDIGYKYVENDKFIANLLKRLGEKDPVRFREKTADVINAFLIAFDDKLNEAFERLQKLSSAEELITLEPFVSPVRQEIESTIKDYFLKREDLGGVQFFYFEPEYNIKSTVATVLSATYNEPVTVFVSPLKKGFLGLSFRDSQQKVDVNKLLRSVIANLPEAAGGGHPFAAGGRIRVEDLGRFKENVRNYLKNQ